jgi:hypothetical protein
VVEEELRAARASRPFARAGGTEEEEEVREERKASEVVCDRGREDEPEEEPELGWRRGTEGEREEPATMGLEKPRPRPSPPT